MTPLDPRRAELVVESGPHLQRVYSLRQLESQPQGLLIGRLNTCQILFPAEARMIGREHARIVARPEGVFLLGLHANGTMVDGALVGQGGEIELHYGARLQLGGEGPILLVRESDAPAPSPTGTIYERPSVETEQDLRAKLDALAAANQELDRQNQQLRAENEALARKPPPAPPSPPADLAPPSEETMALLKRFGQGLLALQKMLSAGPPDPAALQNKLEFIICDLDELHSAIAGTVRPK